MVLFVADFEYCSYNYRAFDIANHFLEWTYDYTESNEPFFKATPEAYPNEMQRLNFVKTYLNEMGSTENPHAVLKEVKVFTLASHFFWGLWSIVNAISSKIPFGYWVRKLQTIQKSFVYIAFFFNRSMALQDSTLTTN